MATTDQNSRAPLNHVPLPALILTAAGAIPFLALAIATWLDIRPFGRPAMEPLSLYALAILSFMGAIHWGLAMARPNTNQAATYAGSVIPALVGWFALILLPVAPALRVMAAAFALLLIYDIRATRRGMAPPWYPRLRVPVTVVVVTALALASMAGASP